MPTSTSLGSLHERRCGPPQYHPENELVYPVVEVEPALSRRFLTVVVIVDVCIVLYQIVIFTLRYT